MLRTVYKKLYAVVLVIPVLLCNIVFAGDNNMARTEICKKNYHELFGGEALSKTGNDIEMMAILQKYIFGDVFTVGNLDIKQREMITVTSLAVQQTMPQLKAHINAALNVGVTPIELREIIYQCAPFIGFPKTLNALNVLNEVFKDIGINTPLENQATVDENERLSKGYAIQNPLYGDEIKQNLSGLPNNMGDDVAKFLTEVCFGDFYTRKGLDIKTRELIVLSILVTTGDTDSLNSHIKANIKVGNSEETIASVIVQCMPYIGFPKAIKALKQLKEVNDIQQPFEKGSLNPYNEFFTGITYLNMLSKNDKTWNSSIGNVTFEPKARTNWHKHSGGQILLVTAGEGRYQEKGKSVQILKKGDVVKIPPNIEHWHGAAPDEMFSHISIETNLPKNQTTWLEPVTDNEYR